MAQRDEALTIINEVPRQGRKIQACLEVELSMLPLLWLGLSAISAHGTVWRECLAEAWWLILTQHGGGDEKEPEQSTRELALRFSLKIARDERLRSWLK